MSERKSRRHQDKEGEVKKKKLPELASYFVVFTQTYPTLILLGYVSGFMDVQLSKISSGSLSATLDIVLLTFAATCAVIGPFVSFFALRYMED